MVAQLGLAQFQSAILPVLAKFDRKLQWFEWRYAKAEKEFERQLSEGYFKTLDKFYVEQYFEHARNNLRLLFQTKTEYAAVVHELSGTLMVEVAESAWRTFLLAKDNFGLAARQVGLISTSDSGGFWDDAFSEEIEYFPGTHFRIPFKTLTIDGKFKERLVEMRSLVEAAYQHSPQRAGRLLHDYFSYNANIPSTVCSKLEQLIKDGDWRLPRLATIFAHQQERLSRNWGAYNEYRVDKAILPHWYDELMQGRLTPWEAWAVPKNFFASYQFLERLGLAHEPSAKSLVVERFNQTDLVGRLHEICAWSEQTKTLVTPHLLGYLMDEREHGFATLEELAQASKEGHFSPKNRLQRELEFAPFVRLKAESFRPVGDWQTDYAEFQKLPVFTEELSQQALTENQWREVDRAGFEAAGLVAFLRGFREQTSRPIVLIGNDRYGRLIVVEPNEDHFKDFIVRYYRVSSSGMHEFDIPAAIAATVVRELGAQPHCVVVDGAVAAEEAHTTRFSAATLGYVNLFMLLNDVLTGGNIEKYAPLSSLPQEHLTGLRQSEQFQHARETIILPQGEPYRVVQWAPSLEQSVVYGNVPATRQPVEDANSPLLVVANPLVYSNHNLPRSLSQSHPGYWDDPERYAAKKVVGFGPHGVEVRSVGPKLEAILDEVQAGIRKSTAMHLRLARR